MKRLPVNREIDANTIRLITEDGKQAGIVSLSEAFRMAEAKGLDLVQMTDGEQDVQVCRLMNYGKRVFEAKKRRSANRVKGRLQIKEIKFRPSTEEGDYQIKLKRLKTFLEKGHRTKLTVRYRGREMNYQELGHELLKRLTEDLVEYGVADQEPVREGRQTTMILAPIKKSKAGKTENKQTNENNQTA